MGLGRVLRRLRAPRAAAIALAAALFVPAAPAAADHPSAWPAPAASEDGLAEIALCQNAGVSRTLPPGPDPRVLEASVPFEPGDARDYLYVRVRTRTGDLAWASPIWADEIA